MRNIPVDVAALAAVTAMSEAVPYADLDGAQKANRDGVPLWEVQVAVVVGGAASVIRVKVAGSEPPKLRAGMPVALSGLSAMTWEIGDRHGLSFTAAAVRPLPSSPPPVAPGGKG
jgi:hypothetical protein